MDEVRKALQAAFMAIPAGKPIPRKLYKHAYWASALQPGEKVIMAGLVRKKRGWLSRVLRREIVLTDTPRLAYFVPKEKSFKANIPWEGKGMEAYVLEDGNPVEWRIVARSGMYELWCEQGMASRWVDSIVAMRDGVKLSKAESIIAGNTGSRTNAETEGKEGEGSESEGASGSHAETEEKEGVPA